MFIRFFVCSIFLSSLIQFHTSSFSTWSVQVILSILIQQNTWKLSKYFWSIFQKVSKLQHHKYLCSKDSISLVSSLNLSPSIWMQLLHRTRCLFIPMTILLKLLRKIITVYIEYHIKIGIDFALKLQSFSILKQAVGQRIANVVL